MTKYNIVKNTLETTEKNKIYQGCTLQESENQYPEIVESFDSLDEAREALTKYRSKWEHSGKFWDVTEYYISDDDEGDLDVYEFAKFREAYFIDYNTGVGNEWVVGPLEYAKERADAGIRYTQQDVVIYDVDDNEVVRRDWIPVDYDTQDNEDKDAEDEIVSYGDFGYYGAWSDRLAGTNRYKYSMVIPRDLPPLWW